LEVFAQVRLELVPQSADDGQEYKATVRSNERNGWGSSFVEGAILLLRGLPYQTVYPSYYNFGGKTMNFTSLVRWDDQKRRISARFAMPLSKQPAKRTRIMFDERDENWNLSQTFFGGLSGPITNLNLKRYAGAVEIRLVQGGRWDFDAAMEV